MRSLALSAHIYRLKHLFFVTDATDHYIIDKGDAEEDLHPSFLFFTVFDRRRSKDQKSESWLVSVSPSRTWFLRRSSTIVLDIPELSLSC